MNTDSEAMNKISKLRKILEIDTSGLKNELREASEKLKLLALIELSNMGVFDENKLNQLVNQLFSNDNGIPEPRWFEGMVSEDTALTVSQILGRHNKESVLHLLMNALNLTKRDSEEEIRICRILIKFTGDTSITRTVVISH